MFRFVHSIIPRPAAKFAIILCDGALAEWLGSALQKHVHRFKSGRCLQDFYTSRLVRRFFMEHEKQCYTKRMPSNKSWTEKQLIEAVKTSVSVREVITKLGLVPAGGNYVQVQGRIRDLQLDMSHFTGARWNKGKTYHTKTRPPIEKLLVKNSPVQSFKLKKRLFEEGLKTSACELCGWAKMSVDGRIPVELDHINGDHTDNRIENLRILCPNCHSLQPTHRGRNKKTALARMLE